MAYIELMDVSQDTAHAWFDWAAAIEMEGFVCGDRARSHPWLDSGVRVGSVL